jgi:hypothetical protein
MRHEIFSCVLRGSAPTDIPLLKVYLSVGQSPHPGPDKKCSRAFELKLQGLRLCFALRTFGFHERKSNKRFFSLALKRVGLDGRKSAEPSEERARLKNVRNTDSQLTFYFNQYSTTKKERGRKRVSLFP